MPFVTMPGITGKIYLPEKNGCISGKHPCPDCFSCQLCSDERCSVCRGTHSEFTSNKKKSATGAMTGQIRCHRKKNDNPGDSE